MGMFSMKSRPSMEELEEVAPDPDAADSSAQDDVPHPSEMSVKCLELARRSIVFAAFRSLGAHMLRTGMSTDDCRKKLRVVANALIAGNDVDVKYGDDKYLSTSIIDEIVSQACNGGDVFAAYCSYEYVDTWTILNGALDNVSQFNYMTRGKGATEGLKDEETALIDKFRKAARDYYTARANYERYFHEVNRQAAVDLIRKYSTTFSQVDAKWLEGVSRSLGISTAPTAKVVQDDAKLVK